MQIRHAKNLIKGNLCASILCFTAPWIMYLLVKAAEYIIRMFFYPYYHALIRETVILLCILLMHFVLIYPLRFAKKLCFYQNCTEKHIPLFGVFGCYGSFTSFLLAASTVLIKKAVTFILCGIMTIPTFWLVRFTFIQNYAAYVQTAAVLLALTAVYFSAVIVYSLFLTEYIAVQSGKNPFYSIVTSIKLMRKNRSKLLLLQLKFIPYMLMCIALIPIFYVLPLYEQTTALFAHEIIFFSPALIPSSSADI